MTKTQNIFRGTGVALVTPFTEAGTLDLTGLRRLVDHVIDGGVEYLVVLGTTGESVTLSELEKQDVINTIVDQNKGRVPLVLGVGGNDTAKVCSQLSNRVLEEFQAVLSVSPAYNKPTQEGIYRHFAQVAAASPKPVILYNVPGRTASNMLPETVARLALDFPNVIGIKEAAGDLVQAMELIDKVPEDFLVISGEDMITLPMTLMGGDGVISVIGQGLPKPYSEMVRQAIAGNNEVARQLHYSLMEGIGLIFDEGNPAGIKSMLSHLGVCSQYVRLPLVEASTELHERIGNFLKDF